MFFNAQKFDEIKGFDENFFLFLKKMIIAKEDLKKLFSYQLNTAHVIHKIGSSVECADLEQEKKLEALYNWHFIWSKTYFKKNIMVIFLHFHIFF